MLYKELLDKFDPEVKDAVSRLFQKARQNQANENDIFLIHLHGFKHPDEAICRKNEISPYMKGPGLVGHSLHDFLEFFNEYNKSTFRSRKEFYDLLKNEDKKKEAEKTEKLSIDIEFLIYLKFWEADLILRRLYNLGRLIHGNDYQWNFNLNVFQKRKTVIENHIKNPLKNQCPKAFNLIDEIYFGDLRDAIAHSNYTFLGRNIHFIKDNLEEFSLKMERWEEIYHKTFLFGFYLFEFMEELNKEFIEKAEGKHFGIPIKIPEKDNVGRKKSKWLKFDHQRHDWLWYENYIKAQQTH